MNFVKSPYALLLAWALSSACARQEMEGQPTKLNGATGRASSTAPDQTSTPDGRAVQSGDATTESGGTPDTNGKVPDAPPVAEGPAPVNKAEEPPVAAKTEDVPKASLTAAQVICASGPKLTKTAAEFAVVCINGQPTQAFASALAAPYKGGATVPLVTIKSVVGANNESEFIFLGVMEVAKPFAAVSALSPTISTGTVTTTNATVVQSVAATRASAGGDDLGGQDVSFALTVKAGPITVNNVSILQQDTIALNPEKTITGNQSMLKAGAADNSDDILSTSVSFMFGDGTAATKIVTVNHQKINNRGQAQTAATSATDIGKAILADVHKRLSQ